MSGFRSQRQRPDREASGGAEPLTGATLVAELVERTAGLLPGTQFQKLFWMTEGVRATPSAVVR